MFGSAAPTGAAHDGDTFALDNGTNARLLGVDAFELQQPGMLGSRSVPLGSQARDALLPFVQPSLLPFNQPAVTPTGEQTYGRPLVTLSKGGTDAGAEIIGQGLGLAAPQYLQGSPRLTDYMEAERLARLNRRGAFAGQFQDPADYRHGVKPGPWNPAQVSLDGKGTVIFGDDPTPFQGLRPEIAQAYLKVASDPRSTASDIIGFANSNGFRLDPKNVDAFLRERNKGRPVSSELAYAQAPQVITDPKDGAVGAAARGLADPFNMLDELGGVVDTLGGTNGRESIWNSDRRFGDILWNNIDQNRAILAYDDAEHPYARFGGQLASGFTIPAVGVEGVGFNAARTALRGGASRLFAEEAARSAVAKRLAGIGAAEGGVAGFGAGEGGPLDRAPNAVIGAGIGAVAAPVLGASLPYGSRGIRWVRDAVTGNLRRKVEAGPLDEVLADAAGEAGKAEIDNTVQPQASAAMTDETPVPTLTGRVVDRIDVNDVPPPPSGFVLDQPIGRPGKLLDRPTPEAMANAARSMRPEDVVPLPSNAVQSHDEAAAIGAGLRPEMVPPNERAMLPPQVGRRSRNPLDLVGFIRASGGLKDHAGELNAYGFTNAPRDLDFARDEGFLGKLINQRDGMTFDQATEAATSAGYFRERPSINEFLDALAETHAGGPGRLFHPDDLESIAAHNAARDQRFALEQAKAEGNPIHEDRGQPITQGDLANLEPPATAYEDLPTVGGKVGNIDLSRIESTQDIRRVLQNTETRVGGFDAAKRGRITHAETEALASELGMTPDALLKRRRGQALNAEEALAARQLLAKSADEMVRLARKAQGGSVEDLAAFREAWLRHVAIQEHVTAATAEAGRALQQFRMAAKSKAVFGRVHRALVDASGGRESLEDVAQRIIDLQEAGVGPGGVTRFASKAAQPKWRDKVAELYYNFLLSGPQTHIVNTVSNLVTAFGQIPEHAVAAGLGQLRRGSADRVLGSELGARAFGMMQGAREGLRAFRYTVKTGDVPDVMTKVEARTDHAISGLKGDIIRTPTRFLAAEDEFFKGVARRMELNGLAVRKAHAEGLKGDALESRIADLTANPTDDMLEKATAHARYVTFQQPLQGLPLAVSNATKHSLIARFFIPFVRTPWNILKFGVERSPAAPMLKEVRENFAAGGARRDLAVSKMALGTGLGLLVMSMAERGLISGNGPLDENARRLKMADGWQPYSIRVGDRWVGYNRLDPISTTIGVAADLVDKQGQMTPKQAEMSAALLIASIVQNLSSKTWLSGLSDIADTLEQPQRTLRGTVGRAAGSIAVPAVVAQVARTFDPTVRDTRGESFGGGVADSIKARLPILSESLPARRDVWGNALQREALGPNMVSPFPLSTARNEPLTSAMLQSGARIAPPSRTVHGVELNPQQYSDYAGAAGQATRTALFPFVTAPEFRGLPLEAQQKGIANLKDAARKGVRERMFGADKAKGAPPPPPGFIIDPPPAGFVLDR
ncbi:hypothetical protein ACFSCW_03450 [Sphingomonas tabacisoli]|uniref:Large polyvalent protein associated domain-containing protein n=1 Tax=Sphingomonas tabacisoli TaxID=2249466 RepID=A0ABW4HYW7_9SPHN